VCRALSSLGGVSVFSLTIPNTVHGIVGLSQSLLRERFELAYASHPSVLFIDDIEEIFGTKHTHNRLTRDLLAVFAGLLDEFMAPNLMLVCTSRSCEACDLPAAILLRIDLQLILRH